MKTVFLRALTTLGITIGTVLLSVVLIFAGQIRLNVGDAAFVPQLLPTGQHFEIFRFDLPEIPQGSRIDFAGLILHIQRDSTRDDCLSFKLVPITSDWTATSLAGGQVLSVDEATPAYAVADANRNDQIELDITYLASAWLRGEKTNQGFVLQTEFLDDQTKFSAKSSAGVKAELVIFYTALEVVKTAETSVKK